MLRDDLEAVLPPPYPQEDLSEDAVARVRLVNPGGVGDGWLTERSAEGRGFIMFGLCALVDHYGVETHVSDRTPCGLFPPNMIMRSVEGS
jgi:hypothetical protein